jgi:hypothetical protein
MPITFDHELGAEILADSWQMAAKFQFVSS